MRLISSLPPISSTTSLSSSVAGFSGMSTSAACPPTATAFRLSSSFQPVPAKLTSKIKSLQFVDMRELLPDKVSLLKNIEELDSKMLAASVPSTSRPKLREVHNLLTWVSCFTTYLIVLADAHQGLIQQRLAYTALIIREARRNGGDGWRSYDAIFRQNAAVNKDLDCLKAPAQTFPRTVELVKQV